MQVAIDSPLQILSSGTYLGRTFQIKEVFHKLTFALAWNEWQIEFENGEQAWIKEAQGNWFVFRFISLLDFEFGQLKIGDQIPFENQLVQLQSIHKVKFEQSREQKFSVIYEFSSHEIFLNVEFCDEVFVFSQGQRIEFAALNATQLRSLDVAHRILKISCPHCHVSLLVRFKSFSQRAICRSCHSIIDINGDEWIALDKLDANLKFEPLLKIGAIIKILGDEFELIACLKLRKNEAQCQTEYLFFSPFKSLRWLSEENGHWTFSRPLHDAPSISDQLIRYRDLKYRNSQISEFKIEYAFGEFFWQFKKDEIIFREEFISPPFIMKFEKINSFDQVYLGRYMSQRQVRSAIQLVQALPKPVGSVRHEASILQHHIKEFLVLNLIFIAVCFLIQLRTNQVPEKIVHESQLVMLDDSQDRLQSTEPFEIRGGPSAMAIAIRSKSPDPVNVEVNEVRSKTKYSFKAATNNHEIIISNVAAGVYFLSLDTSRAVKMPVTYEIHVSYGKKPWSNFYLAVFLMSLPTLLIFILNVFFKYKRAKRGGRVDAKFSR
jgi:hypothetical protein